MAYAAHAELIVGERMPGRKDQIGHNGAMKLA